MIIANGNIEIKCKAGGGIDGSTGYPVPAESSWSDPVPCQYIPVRLNYLALSNGEPRKDASYEILVEASSFVHEQIRLTDRDGGVIGEFPVISVVPLEAVSQVRIIV